MSLNCKLFLGHVLCSDYESENSSSDLEMVDIQRLDLPINITIMFHFKTSRISHIHINKISDFATNRN